MRCAEHIHSVVAGDAVSRVTATGLFGIHEAALQRRVRADHDRYERVFRDLIHALPLRNVDRALFRLMLFGAMNWTLVWYRGRLSPSDIARNIVALLRQGGQCADKSLAKASTGARKRRE